MDLAYSWADPRVFEIVQTKWESLPVPKGDKKGGKGKGKDKKARPKTAENKEGAPQVCFYVKYQIDLFHTDFEIEMNMIAKKNEKICSYMSPLFMQSVMEFPSMVGGGQWVGGSLFVSISQFI